jgi:hypothetical protein
MSSTQSASIPVSIPSSQDEVADPIRRVGVIGLGRMGEAFASNLLADGY